MSIKSAIKWIENHGYRITYQLGSYPSPGFYIAIPRGPFGRTLEGSANYIVRQIKHFNRYGRY